VLTGTGDIPVKETVRVLATGGYKGYYCFEWEKRWHPDIDEPEVAFPQYAKVMRQYLAEAGVTA
jgi:sugar phosphate isomerase/epimerase